MIWNISSKSNQCLERSWSERNIFEIISKNRQYISMINRFLLHIRFHSNLFYNGFAIWWGNKTLHLVSYRTIAACQQWETTKVMFYVFNIGCDHVKESCKMFVTVWIFTNTLHNGNMQIISSEEVVCSVFQSRDILKISQLLFLTY